MSIAEYKHAKQALKDFDAFAILASRPGAKMLVPGATLTITHPRRDGYSGDHQAKNAVFDLILHQHLNTSTLYRLMARARGKLVEDCRRLKVSAANEARGIIGEDVPK